MKINTLRLLRVILAGLIFTPVLLFFCDFANILPHSFSNLMRIQFVPAVLAGSGLIVISLLVLTLLFGRIYCSVICPLGVSQDIIAWFTQRGKKKNRKKRWYKYTRPLSILRYSILIICVLFFIFGITTPLLYLDPYSNFGRVAVNLFRPLVMEGNNLLNWIALKFHIYNFYYTTIYTVTVWSFAIAATMLLTVGIMALLRGRLFCNSICPVGSFLGLISRFSFFKITLNNSLCNSCGLCEKACKSQCINSKEKHIDYSRCVACFNCLKRCKSDSISYRFAIKRKYQPVMDKYINSPIETEQTDTIGMTRRSFLATSTTIAATFPVLPALAQRKGFTRSAPDTPPFRRRHSFGKRFPADRLPITPPGSISLDHFIGHCTACHLCITHCPQQILKPAGFDYGFDYAFKPSMVFYEKGFCNYQCTACSETCPNGAIKKLTKEEKIVTQVGIALFDRNHCVVITQNTSCGACSEHCPTQAVRMEPYINGLTLPHVYDDLCIGCGGCESICPVRPIKAINIIANEIHQTAEKPPEGEMKVINQDELDFGF